MPLTLEKITCSRFSLLVVAFIGIGALIVAPFVEDRVYEEPAHPLSYSSVDPSSDMTNLPAGTTNFEYREKEESGQVLKFRYHDASGKALTFAEAMHLLAGNDGPSARFRHQVIDALRAVPYPAAFWECAPASGDTAPQTAFEFVVVNSSALSGVTVGDSGAFAEHLALACVSKDPSAAATPVVATFGNLGGDAVLVAPCPLLPPTTASSTSFFSSSSSSSALSASAYAPSPPPPPPSLYGEYAHLLTFVRRAPLEQAHALFQAVGAAVLDQLEVTTPTKPAPPLSVSDSATRSTKPLWLSTSGQCIRSLPSYLQSDFIHLSRWSILRAFYNFISHSCSTHPSSEHVIGPGLGVPWLHVRLDARPKYYTYAPFKHLAY